MCLPSSIFQESVRIYAFEISKLPDEGRCFLFYEAKKADMTEEIILYMFTDK